MTACAFLPSSPRPFGLSKGTDRKLPCRGRFHASVSSENDRGLESYLQSAGVQFHNAGLCKSLQGLRGVRSTELIVAKSLVVSVPRKVALTAHVWDSGSNHKAACSYGWWLPLTIALLNERILGSRSRWAGYIEALPAEPPGAIWACETLGARHVAEQLRPYGMAGFTRRYWDFLRGAYAWAKTFLPSVCGWRDFIWAVSTVQSRAFRVDTGAGSCNAANAGDATDLSALGSEGSGNFALLPGIDMLNHSTNCRSRLKYDDESDTFGIVVHVEFEKDKEVFVSYGQKSNDDFLFFYGFVEGNNPADCITIRSSQVLRLGISGTHSDANESDQSWRKEKLLRDAGLVADDKSYKVRREAMDEEIMAILRVCMASENELMMLNSVSLSGAKGRIASLSLGNELRVWHCIAVECDRLLRKLPKPRAGILEKAMETRNERVRSAAWDWHRAGQGNTLAEALYLSQRTEVLSLTRDRVLHFARVSEAIGRVTTVLLPPSQSILSTASFDCPPGEDESVDKRYFVV